MGNTYKSLSLSFINPTAVRRVLTHDEFPVSCHAGLVVVLRFTGGADD
jgi:hypothetical protein